MKFTRMRYAAAIVAIVALTAFAFDLMLHAAGAAPATKAPPGDSLSLSLRTLDRQHFYEVVVPLAKAEGTLTLYNFPASFPPFWKRIVIPRFEAKYGIKVAFYNVRPDVADQQLLAFRALRRVPPADVYFAPGSHVGFYRNESLAARLDLARILPEAAAYPAELFARLDSAERFAPFHMNQTALAYDSARIALDALPHELDGLLAWARAHPGQFAFTSPKNGGSGEGLLLAAAHRWMSADCRQRLDASWRDTDEARRWIDTGGCLTQTWRYLSALASVSVMTNGNADTQNLIANHAAVIGTAWEDMAYTFSRLKLIPPTVRLAVPAPGMPGSSDLLFVVAGARHPAAALLLIDFALSLPIQQWKLDQMASRSGRRDLADAQHEHEHGPAPSADFMLPASSLDAQFGWPSAPMMAALDDAFVHEVVERR